MHIIYLYIPSTSALASQRAHSSFPPPPAPPHLSPSRTPPSRLSLSSAPFSFLAKRHQLLSLPLCEHPSILARSLALLQRMQCLFNDAKRVALERFCSLCFLVVGSEDVLRQYLYFCNSKATKLSRTSRAQEACSTSGPVLYALMLAAPPFAAKAAKRDGWIRLD